MPSATFDRATPVVRSGQFDCFLVFLFTSIGSSHDCPHPQSLFVPKSLFGRATLIVLVPVADHSDLLYRLCLFSGFTKTSRDQMTDGRGRRDELSLILDRDLEAAEDRDVALSLDRARALRQMRLNLRREIWTDEELAEAGPSGSFLTFRAARSVSTLERGSARTFLARRPVDLSRRPVVAWSQVDSLRLGRSRSKYPASQGLGSRNPHQFLVLIGVTAVLMSIIALALSARTGPANSATCGSGELPHLVKGRVVAVQTVSERYRSS